MTNPRGTHIRDRAQTLTILSIILMLLGCFAWISPAYAGQVQLNSRHVSNAQIAAAMVRQGFTPSFAQAAANLSSNVEDRNGDLEATNGKAFGVMQVWYTNLASSKICGCSGSQYMAMSLDEQVAIWKKVYYSNISAGVKALDHIDVIDGQKVDDALKLACDQLGAKVCNGFVDARSCSATKDGNGTTVCKMAAGIRLGANNIGNTPSSTNDWNSTASNTNTINGNVDDITKDESTFYKPLMGIGMSLGQSDYCWTCDAIIYGLKISETILDNSIAMIIDETHMLFIWIFFLNILWRLGNAIVSGTQPMKYIAISFFKGMAFFFFALTPATTLSDYIVDVAYNSVINDSASAAQYAINTISSGMNIPITTMDPNQGKPTTSKSSECTYEASAKVTLTHLIVAETALTQLACTIHATEQVEIQMGITIAQSNGQATNLQDALTARVINLLGLFMAIIALMGLLRFGLVVFDIIISLTVSIVFTPWCLFCWIFPSTSRVTRNYLLRLATLPVAFLISGISTCVAIKVVLISLYTGLGLDPASASLDPADIVIKAQKLAEDYHISDPETTSSLIFMILSTACGAYISSYILERAQGLTAALTGVNISNAMSRGLVGGIQGFGSFMGRSAAQAGGFVGVVIGKVLKQVMGFNGR